jgi:Flp pilus assembly protein TadG
MAKRKNQKGSAMIEFALCFLLMFGLLYGVMEFSRIVYSRTVLAGATREASRYAMVHGSRSASPATNEAIRAQVLRWSFGLNPAALVVNTTWDPSNSPGSTVRVEASYTIAPFTRLILDTPLTLASRSEMVISQ